MAKAVWKGLQLSELRVNEKSFFGNIDSFLELGAAVLRWPESSNEALELLRKTGWPELGIKSNDEVAAMYGPLSGVLWTGLSSHNKTRLPAAAESAEGAKCSVCGRRDQVGDGSREFWRNVAERGRGESNLEDREAPQLSLGEGLCAVCLTRRFAPQYFFGTKSAGLELDWRNSPKKDRPYLRFPSVPSVAVAPFRLWLKEELTLLQQIYRNPARKARLLAQAAENRSGAYAVYVSTGSAGSHSQRPRSPGIAAVGKFAAVVLTQRERAQKPRLATLTRAWVDAVGRAHRHKDVDFTPPGNLLPGLGALGSQDGQSAYLDFDGSWCFDEAYEPQRILRDHGWTKPNGSGDPDADLVDRARIGRSAHLEVRSRAPLDLLWPWRLGGDSVGNTPASVVDRLVGTRLEDATRGDTESFRAKVALSLREELPILAGNPDMFLHRLSVRLYDKSSEKLEPTPREWPCLRAFFKRWPTTPQRGAQEVLDTLRLLLFLKREEHGLPMHELLGLLEPNGGGVS